MRTLHQLTHKQTDQQKRQAIAEAGDALGGLKETDAVWQALRGRVERSIAEAIDIATDSDPAKREWFAGSARALMDLWQELEDLRTGEWKTWPEFKDLKREPEKKDDEDED